MGKIGRNSLCPCGSGLKYKKCCAVNTKNGADNITPLGDLQWRQLRQLIDTLSGDLMKYAAEEHYAPDLSPAIESAVFEFIGYPLEEETSGLAETEFFCAFMPLLALNNLSPNQAAKKPGMKDRLEALLAE